MKPGRQGGRYLHRATKFPIARSSAALLDLPLLTLPASARQNRGVRHKISFLGTLSGLLFCLPCVAAQPSSLLYRDPMNRFQIEVPQGWKVRPLGDTVQIVHGDAYLSVMVFDHTSTAHTLVEELGQQIGKRWRHFERQDRKETNYVGQAADTAGFRGVNPQGQEAMLKLTGIVSGGTGYVLVEGAPLSDLAKATPSLDRIRASFQILSSKPASSAPAEPTIGMEVADLSLDDAPSYGLNEPSGALVVRLVTAGPADLAGVALHDLIVSAAGGPVESAAAFQQAVRSHKAGDVIALEVLRIAEDGKTVQRKALQANLEAAPRAH